MPPAGRSTEAGFLRTRYLTRLEASGSFVSDTERESVCVCLCRCVCVCMCVYTCTLDPCTHTQFLCFSVHGSVNEP